MAGPVRRRWRRAAGRAGSRLLGATWCAPGSKSQAPPSATPAGLVQVPDHFLVGEIDGAATREPKPGEGCHNPMVDPKDGTRLTLVRSSSGMGDYEAPEGRYGVGKGQLLRLDCANGRPMEWWSGGNGGPAVAVGRRRSDQLISCGMYPTGTEVIVQGSAGSWTRGSCEQAKSPGWCRNARSFPAEERSPPCVRAVDLHPQARSPSNSVPRRQLGGLSGISDAGGDLGPALRFRPIVLAKTW
jgi:hypothetical protein